MPLKSQAATSDHVLMVPLYFHIDRYNVTRATYKSQRAVKSMLESRALACNYKRSNLDILPETPGKFPDNRMAVCCRMHLPSILWESVNLSLGKRFQLEVGIGRNNRQEPSFCLPSIFFFSFFPPPGLYESRTITSPHMCRMHVS
jgi:hypothetical protein